MLKQRIITAVWLVPLVLAGLFGLEGGAFALFTAGIVLLGVWEWNNLAGIQRTRHHMMLVGAAAIAMLLLWQSGAVLSRWPLGVAAAGWLVSLYWVMRYPEALSQWRSTSRRLLMGACVLLPCWVGFNLLRESGGVWLLFVVLLVWTADIGAYFAGRAWGKHKLAPRVSPGKSWEGVLGGLAATLVLALLFSAWQGLGGWDALVLMGVTLVVTLVSVLGDLFESMLKRYRGIKDASQLLPGHGGILDRIDSLTAAVPVFALLYPLVANV